MLPMQTQVALPQVQPLGETEVFVDHSLGVLLAAALIFVIAHWPMTDLDEQD